MKAPTSDERRTIGGVAVKIGVTAEPSREFSNVAYALGFVHVVPCHNCAHQGTPDCPIKKGTEYMMDFCSNGRKRDDD